MRYIVTSKPTWDGNGTPTDYFSEGDVVEVGNSTPDSDGDVLALNITKGAEVREYVALSCLTPEDEVRLPVVKKAVREVITKTEVETYTLTISREDALALVAISGHIGGDADETPRGVLSGEREGFVSKLFEALGLDAFGGYSDAKAELGIQIVGGLTLSKVEEAA